MKTSYNDYIKVVHESINREADMNTNEKEK